MRSEFDTIARGLRNVRKAVCALSTWRGLGLMASAATLIACGAGCDALTFTPEGLVKFRIQTHSRAIAAKNWDKARSFYASEVQWQTSEFKKRGPDVAGEFLDSIRNIQACDNFFTDVHSIKKSSETRMVAHVTFQAHTVVSSMTMRYSNVFWDAKLLWIRQGATNWKLAGIKELHPRKKGKFNRLGV